MKVKHLTLVRLNKPILISNLGYGRKKRVVDDITDHISIPYAGTTDTGTAFVEPSKLLEVLMSKEFLVYQNKHKNTPKEIIQIAIDLHDDWIVNQKNGIEVRTSYEAHVEYVFDSVYPQFTITSPGYKGRIGKEGGAKGFYTGMKRKLKYIDRIIYKEIISNGE
jgi:hypothetical protein